MHAPPYGGRSGWTPAHDEAFGDGGAFPECLCVQYPQGQGLGPKGERLPEELLHCNPDSLQSWVGVALLRQPCYRPEFTSLLTFVRSAAHAHDWSACVPQATTSIARISQASTADAQGWLAEAGRPVVVMDAFQDWPARRKWSFDFFRRRCGSANIIANDRAPARRADAASNSKQRTALVPLAEYIVYLQSRPATLIEAAAGDLPVPFYLNGWRPFQQFPDLLADCPGPYFMAGIDDSSAIMAAIGDTIFGRSKAPEQQRPDSAAETAAAKPWWHDVITNLTKVFMGPAGTITRLHYDAGAAHGWLGQIVGRKLFVLYAPTDTPYLYNIPGETETQQSGVDPLMPDLAQYPLYAKAQPLAFVVQPGEAVVIPQGWWHYAVALDPSITVMHNFYNAHTNAAGMVEMVLKIVSNLKRGT